MSLYPFAGISYTMLMHFFSYDDKIKSDPSYDADWATNPSKWKISDFIPELFSNTPTWSSFKSLTTSLFFLVTASEIC